MHLEFVFLRLTYIDLSNEIIVIQGYEEITTEHSFCAFNFCGPFYCAAVPRAANGRMTRAGGGGYEMNLERNDRGLMEVLSGKFQEGWMKTIINLNWQIGVPGYI
jgi:hypothetical protein